MLKINNLHVSVADKPILKGLTLEVPAGEVHAVMGPNGAGLHHGFDDLVERHHMLAIAAQSTWERLVNERTNQVPWARFVAQGGQRGFVLTGAGEVRLGVLWHNQVLSPYLKALAASHGPEVAARVAADYR